MFSLSKISFAGVALAMASVCMAGGDPPIPGKPACDADPSSLSLTKTGVAKKWQVSNDPVYYLSPGQSYCGENYTDQSNVVCLAPGYFSNAIHHRGYCNNWVQVTNPENGIVSFGRILDECGTEANSTFGCNDIYLSKQMFEELAGNQREAAIDKGNLDSVSWRFALEPCWATWAGLPGQLASGAPDLATGRDSNGFLRCGRKTGGDRIVGPNSAKVCNMNIKDCNQAAKIAAGLPKYGGTTPEHQNKAVAYDKNLKLIGGH